MENYWVLIYETNKGFEAEIVKGMLLEHEIEAFIINKQDSSYHFGSIEMYVSANDVMKAKTLILTLNL